MLIEPFIFYELIVGVVILSTLLIVLVTSYTKKLRRLSILEKQQESIGKKTHQKAEHIIDHARDKALSIVEEAKVQTHLTTLSETQEVTMEKTSQKIITMYESLMNNLKNDTINLFKNISNNLQNTATHEVSDFREILEKETLTTQKVVSEKIEKEYEEAQKQIQEYKKSQLQKVDADMYDLIQEVTQLVFKKQLSSQNQADLVIEALEEAKKDLP